jgi:hypothetical protein
MTVSSQFSSQALETEDLPTAVKPIAQGTDHEPSRLFAMKMPVPNFPVNVNPASMEDNKITPLQFSKRSLGMPLVLGSNARSKTLSALQIMPGMVKRLGGFSGIVFALSFYNQRGGELSVALCSN